MTTIKIHNAETGEVIERDMTANELAQWEADKVEAKAKAKAEVDAVSAKALLLEKLGLTAEEAKLLLS